VVDVTTSPGEVLSTAQVADDVTADFFRVLSSPIRLGVVRLLLEGERCVSELVDELGIAQPRLSNHLACLRTCGFVAVRREGTFLYYALADERLAECLRLGETLASSRVGVLTVCPVLSREQRTGKD
jgi:DNA-binding transcriptional ArsR family regulator